MLFTSVKGQCGGDAVYACLSGPQSDSYRGHSRWREKDASAVSSLAKILTLVLSSDPGSLLPCCLTFVRLYNHPEPSFLIS